jgi:hypothetical protein
MRSSFSTYPGIERQLSISEFVFFDFVMMRGLITASKSRFSGVSEKAQTRRCSIYNKINKNSILAIVPSACFASAITNTRRGRPICGAAMPRPSWLRYYQKIGNELYPESLKMRTLTAVAIMLSMSARDSGEFIPFKLFAAWRSTSQRIKNVLKKDGVKWKRRLSESTDNTGCAQLPLLVPIFKTGKIDIS